MKKTLILLGVTLGVMALSLTTASTRLYAQRGEPTVGDSVTLILPAGVYQDSTWQIVVTGPAKAPKAVGTCTTRGSVINDPGNLGAANIPTQVAFYDADVVPRVLVNNVWVYQQDKAVKSEAAISWPGYTGWKDLKQGWHLGGGTRRGGVCGPGYEIVLAYLTYGAPGGVSQAFLPFEKKK